MKGTSRMSGIPDNGDDPGKPSPSSHLLLLSPLASESLALSTGLSRFLGNPVKIPSISNEMIFSPYVTVRFLGPGAGPARRLESVQFSAFRKVLLAGFAGGLSVRATVGKAFAISELIGKDGRRLSLPSSAEWSRRLALETAVSVEADKILERPGEKSALFQKTQADLVDMESYAWMQMILNKVPDAGVLRVVSDDRETGLPREMMQFSDENGMERRGRGFKALLKNPVTLAPFFRALPTFLLARRTLVSLGEKLGETLWRDIR
jgi:hypothetical protein